MKIGFLFGAGAEICYDMPSGGKFALDIFRQDTTEMKNKFKTIRDSIDSTTHYAATWLPEDYNDKNVGTYGKSVFENIIKGTIEHNRDNIINKLNSFDEIAYDIVHKLFNQNIDVNKSISQITGQRINNMHMNQKIAFTSEFEDGNRLFANNYFSALLTIYSRKDKISLDIRRELGKIIIAVLQLQIGALSEKLSRKINDNLFKKKDDEIDLFDDLGEIINLNYTSSGVSGLEYLLDTNRSNVGTDEEIILYFAQEVLEEIFASVLDYKSLIDSNWHYLYCPKAEWNKFCKISIFLWTVREYIQSQCNQSDKTKKGYYNDLREAVDAKKIEVSAVATTNYTSLISDILKEDIYFLNGSTEKYYDPYINKIMTEEELKEQEAHFYVPLMFTQSGTKPMTSIAMSIEYVDVYNKFKDADLICSIGFGFNPDDEHINGVIRTLINEGKRLTVIELKNNKSENEREVEIAEKLKVTNYDNVNVIFVDQDRLVQQNKSWIDVILSENEK